jgi:class 3 adenylate cyclase/alpha-beta hydrolase superfamily lysophospholipase
LGQVPTETRYAQQGETTLAWTAVGDGPTDLLFLPGIISHIEHVWDDPGMAGFLERLSSFARVILMDRRGSGLSDPLDGALELEDEVDDVIAVLDAAESECAVLLGYLTGGPLAIKVAAERPERVRALVLYAAVARSLSAPGYDWASDARERSAAFDRMIERWGTGAMLDDIAPTRAGDTRLRSWLARLERLSSSPGELRRAARTLSDFDVRADLGELRVPTLILHRMGDRLIDVRHSRYMAERIPGARYVELDGIDNLPSVGDTTALLGEIEEFLTGGRRRLGERELLTILFSDIVGSTGHAARLGDAGWRDLLVAHDAVVRRELDRFGGREVKTIGDAFLVSFDGPPSRAVRCAQALVDGLAPLGLTVRIGLHTGECEVLGDDVGGMAVHIAARVAALAEPGEVLASGTVYGTVVGAGVRFKDRGTHRLRDVPGRWPLFAVL